MPARFPILCVTKSDRPQPHARITHIAVAMPDGSRWRLTQASAVARLQAGQFTLCLERDGCLVDVVVAHNRHGQPYLKSVKDAIHPDDLLSLPECL